MIRENYEEPTVESFEVEVEKGFATSFTGTGEGGVWEEDSAWQK